ARTNTFRIGPTSSQVLSIQLFPRSARIGSTPAIQKPDCCRQAMRLSGSPRRSMVFDESRLPGRSWTFQQIWRTVMTRVAEFRPQQASDSDEWHLRVDLAAAFRVAAMHGGLDAVANHFSLAVSHDGKTFLVNPRWRHFSRIKASDLLKLDAGDRSTLGRPDAPDPTAWYIHGRMHAAVPQARCVMHLHPPYATV